VPEHGYVSAGALTDALVRAALNLGATLTTARVLAVAGGEVASVRTADERLETDAVIIAAGSWSADLGDAVSASRHPAHGAAPPGNQGPVVKPIRGQLVQLRLGARPASRVIWGSGCYLVPWRDGTVLAGATVEDVGFDESATASGVAQLLGASAGLMPVLREAAFEEVRVGLRPMTADELPAIGRSSSMRNVFYATGHYRNGVLLAPLTARLVADLVLEDREGEDLALVRPDRLGL
jgi:glycine oxidase